MSSANTNMRSESFGRLFNISIAFVERGSILGRLPFSAVILTTLCWKSMLVQVSFVISPHRAPVSFSI